MARKKTKDFKVEEYFKRICLTFFCHQYSKLKKYRITAKEKIRKKISSIRDY